MRKEAVLTIATVWLASIALAVPEAAAPQNRPVPPPTDAVAVRELIDRYCFGCHNERVRTANLALDAIEGPEAGSQAETWEKVVRKVTGPA